MPVRNESYLLQKSPQFSIATGAENRTDLVLTPNPNVNKGAIFGYVKHGQTPLHDAMVKILTPGGDPVDHQFTNTNGLYISAQLPPGTYQVVASYPGFLTGAPVTVTLGAAAYVQADSSLTPDPRAAKNTLYGLVLEQGTGHRISGACVDLLDTQGQTVANTLTNSDGQYLIGEINNGSYRISADKPGYLLPVPLSINVTGSQLLQTNITLESEVGIEGTVSGFIRDANGNALSGAFVGLYAVSGSTETLVYTTYTNVSGYYLFGEVDAGNYVVKAKVDTII